MDSNLDVGLSSFNQSAMSSHNMPSTNINNILNQRDPDPPFVPMVPEVAEDAIDMEEDPLQDDDEDYEVTQRRSYKCIYCDKSFKKSSHMKQHLRSHTGKMHSVIRVIASHLIYKKL